MGILLLGQALTPFTLALTFDASAQSAPQSFRDAMNAAAAIMMATILDPITVRIQIGYGDIFDGAQSVASNQSAGGSNSSFITYANLLTALQNTVTSSIDTSFVAALPGGSSIQGQSNMDTPYAAQKALGFRAARAAGTDGNIGVGVSIPNGNLIGVALHEFAHAMGRNAGSAPFCLGRFTSVGTRIFTAGTGTASWFSVDGGTTNLNNYDTTTDTSDFLSSGNSGTEADTDDPFNAIYTGTTKQTLTLGGKHQLDCMGFNIAP